MPLKPSIREPAYSFTIPSLHDDLALDCRIYHPEEELESGAARNADEDERPRSSSMKKGAVLAHPYPPLGGSYDDPVILSCAKTLVGEGYVVATFNFRGAGDSAGRSSWSARPEVEDYTAVVGLLIYYMHCLGSRSNAAREAGSTTPPDDDARSHGVSPPIHLLLGGYSFGASILARLPPVSKIIKRFEWAERGVAAAEIFLRARTLAQQTHAHREQGPSTSSRGRALTADEPPGSSPQPSRASPVTVGGEETDPSERRRSRDVKHSADMIREVPKKIRSHIRKHSGSGSGSGDKNGELPTSSSASASNPTQPAVDVAYLVISPVLVPLTTTLLPPGFSFSAHESGLFSLTQPTLLLFGSEDGFTSSKKLRQWSTKLSNDSSHCFEWEQIDGAGHFWREPGVMRTLRSTIATWTKRSKSRQNQQTPRISENNPSKADSNTSESFR
ncbi:Hypothetical predicted protein [Lecanosticta acicola]|uniref:AB hydrolase-1 domain-containing protein n=1 Tax=Lecanosticta acicola TaxID=111012 RepID=A0AAI8Z6Q6_9PEZI|nr:Hypothetical predicted protein [Lecanosticta acicola]